MPIVITDDCINCGACAVECPSEAIFGPAENYRINGIIFLPLTMEHFFIDTEVCNECLGINEIKCIAVCPMDSIIISN